MNTPVSFEIAKLLKEKGFDSVYPQSVFYNGDYVDNLLLNLFITKEDYTGNNKQYENDFLAPTIAEAVMWLYEKHKIWIEVIETDLLNLFYFQIKRHDNTRLKNGDYNSPTEAYLNAIEYILNKLIQ